MSHTSLDYFIVKAKDTQNTNDDEEYKEDTSKHQDGNECVDNPENSDTLCDNNVINTTKEEEALLNSCLISNIMQYNL